MTTSEIIALFLTYGLKLIEECRKLATANGMTGSEFESAVEKEITRIHDEWKRTADEEMKYFKQ